MRNMSQRQAVLRPGSKSADVPQWLPLRLRPVLLELLSGVPDTTASRRLSMSPRTYSRRVAELLDYLGVATRFQAGAEIVRRGWVPGRNSALIDIADRCAAGSVPVIADDVR